MPQPHHNAPDWHDVANVLDSLGRDYNLVVVFSTTVRSNGIQTIGKALSHSYAEDSAVVYQALVTQRYDTKQTYAQTCYTLAFDLWCQADGAGATAARRGPPVGWDGKPERLRRRTAQ